MRHRRYHLGFTLIETLVVIAIFTLIFGGLFFTIQFILKLISINKASTSALAIATERIEYIRSLPYLSIGTVSGIPSGSIPQNATSSLNGTTFYERTLIQYVDSPDDGIGATDANGILADYKEVKVEISWQTQSGTSSIFLLTNVVPIGIESTTGGGTVVVNVFDADVQPVAGASVRIYNDTTTTTVDVTRNTNASGVAMFAGAPAAGNYQITVSKTGYSTDQTYVATTSNPNPTTPPVAVVESNVSTMNFQIDRLSDLRIRTLGPATKGSFSDVFNDMSTVLSVTNTVLNGGFVELVGSAGSYVPVGSVVSVSSTPATITSWEMATWDALTPANTTVSVSVYAVSSTSVYTLVPDSDLAGNSSGFTSGIINLSQLSTTTYPALALGATLTSGDVNVTPSLDAWSLTHVVSEPSIGNIPYTLIGSKSIGTTLGGAPIPKYTDSDMTDSVGESMHQDLEWDSYDVLLNTGAYDIAEVIPRLPYPLEPGVSETLDVVLVGDHPFTLRVAVRDPNGESVVGASVELMRSGFSETLTSSLYGQVFFNSGFGTHSDFRVIVNAPGFVSQTITDVIIDGDEVIEVILIPT